MKSKIIIASLALLTFGCLDVQLEPEVGDTTNRVFTNFLAFQQYGAKVYGSLTLTGQEGPAGDADLQIINDEGFSSYLRVWWKSQELTTDEAVIAWSDAGIRDLHDHAWGADNQFIRVLYYRIYYTITLANDYLAIAKNAPGGMTTDQQEYFEQLKREVRFIRAFSYWHALDMFRNVPLITALTGEIPNQSSPQQVFDFIISELDDIESGLLEANQDAQYYGRVNKAAVQMLKAKMYLNAEVYTGQAMYTECKDACQKILDLGIYSIHPQYEELFMGDNHLRTNEIIWAIVHDGLVSQNWGGTTTIIRGGIGGDMDPLESGVPSGWGGYRTTSALVSLFPLAATSDDASSPDGRAMFFNTNQTLAITDIADFTHGYAVPKFSNIEASTGQRAAGSDFVSTDFPVFRLADAYLMMAEAELRSGGTVSGSTLDLLNSLRQRAYGDSSGDLASTDVDLDLILDERGREFYLEATRRTDLVRFGRFSGGDYLWPWKGGVDVGTSTTAFLDIFPIPSSELIANPAMTQNDGY